MREETPAPTERSPRLPVKPFRWRIPLLTLSLLLSTTSLLPFLDTGAPIGGALAVVDQGDATACWAYGANWTSCQNAFASDDLYAYANASAGGTVIRRVATTTDSADASSWSFSHTVPSGSNRILLLALATDSGETVSGTPQYGSTSFGLITTFVHTSGKPRVTLYGIIAPTVGTALVTGNLAATDKYTAGATSYTGVHQTMPADFPVTTGQGTSGTTMSITVPSEVGDLVVDFTANLGVNVPNVGSGQTEVHNEEMGGPGASDHRATSSEEEGASSVTMSWTGKEDGKEWVSVGLNLNRASQYARPDADLSITNWSDSAGDGVNYTKIDETTPDGDATYTQTAVNPANGDDAEFRLSNVRDPQRSDGHILRYRYRNAAFGGGSSQLDLTVELKQGAAVIASWTHTFISSQTYVTQTQTLSAAQADAITDYTDLRVNFDVTFFSGSQSRQLRVTWLEFEVPGAPASGNNDTVWAGFGIDLGASDEVQQVEVGVEWFRIDATPILNVTVSWDGGSTWATNQTATNKSADDDAVEWLDFTSAAAWNASTLRDSSLRVRAGTNASGARLDHLAVRTTYNDAPEVSSLRLEDATGGSLAGGLLDPATAYNFLFNVTDEDGWADIGTDGAVGVRMWYDGNVTPELSFIEQTNGSDYRIELRYEDVADPGNATLDEWSVVEGSATYDASASSLMAILNGTTLVGYAFNLSVSLGVVVKAASEPTNSTPGAYNDPDSWNVEVLAFDGSVGDRQPRAAGGEHLEFGVFALAFMGYAAAASPTTLRPGDTTVFTVDFFNTGQGPASRVWVNVTFPVELTYVSDDAAAIGGVRSCCESFEFTDVDPGSYVFNVTASADGGVANGTVTVTNLTYQALDAKSRPSNQTAEDVSVTIVNAVMSYAASASPTTLQPGDTTVFRVDFTNAGQGDAGTVWINVTLPAELTYISDDAALIGGVLSGTYSFAFADVAPGVYVFNLTVSAVGGIPNGTVVLTGFRLEALDLTGASLSPSSVDVPVTFLNALLSYAVEATPAGLEPDDTTTFTIWFNNTGMYDAERVWVNVTLPAGLGYVSDTAASLGGTVSGTYSFEFATVAPGTYAFLLVARLDGGVIDGMSLVTNFTFESVDSLWVPFSPAYQDVSVDAYNAILNLAVSVSPSEVWPGAQTTFQVTFDNTGQARAATVWINVTLATELVYVSDDSAAIGGTLSGTYDYEFADLVPGSYTFNLTVAAVGGIPDGMAVLTRFVMEGTDLAGVPLFGESQDVAVTLANAVLALVVTASPSPAEPGDALTLTATVTNAGAAPAESLVIEGTVDANATYLSSSPAGTYDGFFRLVRWNLASLAAGTQAAFRWTVTVNLSVSDGVTITARATAESQDMSGTPLPLLEDTTPVDVVSASFAPVLVLTSLDAERGDEVLASLHYNNTGAGPSGTVWVNWTLNGHYELVALIPQPLFTTTADGFDVLLPSASSGTQRLDARLRVIRGLEDNLTMGIDVSFVSTYRNGNPLVVTDLGASVTLLAPSVGLTLATRSSAVQAGTAFALDITATNAGQTAAMGWLNLTLPNGVAFRGDDGTYPVTETADGVSWLLPSIPAGATVNLVVTLTADSELGLQSFRFAMAWTDGKGSSPASAISNAVSLQIGPGASTPPVPWLWLLLAALVGGIVLFALTRRRRTSIEEVFVVHQTGVLIAHRSKTLTPDKDEDVLAAMLSTVQSFIQDAFTEHENTPVRGLQFDKFNILVEQGTHHYVAVVFRGRDNGALQARLHDLSQQIEEEFGETLATWEGTSSDVRPVKALLPLLWGKRKARERRGRPKAAAVPDEPPEVSAGQPEAEVVAPEITVSAVRKARKAELRAWCLHLELDDSGTVADLRKRLLHDLEMREERSPSEAEAESGLPKEPVEEDAEVGFDESSEGSPQDDVDESQAEEMATAIEDDIEAIGGPSDAMPEEEPPETLPETSQDTPETPSDRGVIGEVATPFVVLGEGEEAVEKRPKTKKGRRKKTKKGKKGKPSAETEERPSEEALEERPADPTQVASKGEAEPEVEPAAEAIGEVPSPPTELTVKQIWDAPKSKLQEWCRMSGLDDTGPIMNMRLRLLSRIEPE